MPICSSVRTSGRVVTTTFVLFCDFSGVGIAPNPSSIMSSTPSYRAFVLGLVMSLSSCERSLEPVACDCWVPKASVPTARVALGVAALNGRLYTMGGFGDNQAFYPVLEVYNP